MPHPAIPTSLTAVRQGHEDLSESSPNVARAVITDGDAPRWCNPVEIDARNSSQWTVRIDSPTEGEDPGRRWRAAGAALARAGREHGAELGIDVVVVEMPRTTTEAEVHALTIGIVAGSHELTLATTRTAPLGQVLVQHHDDVSATIRHAQALARGTALARDLAMMPSNLKPPRELARMIEHALPEGLEATIRDETWLRQHGFGGILAVGSGSAEPPRLTEIRWRPAGASGHIVLVGKGITFDTGGISVKPAANMHLMKTDMAGAAAVAGAMAAIAELDLPIAVTALLPSAENMLSGSAYRPGDVVTHYGGITSEVTNTDAEGRMVLADALAYAVATLEPDLIIDAATLTGAMKIALGMRTGAILTESDDLAQRIARAGATVGEKWWRLPLSAEYQDAVSSRIADVRQAPAGPGAITAALFLREFVSDVPWAHLDIAGPARTEETYDEVNPVASGFAARTLATVVEQLAAP
ncbi:peptidase M17 [Hoyosella sp. G463]|uniref:Probable cytosol aminopeptidase n=1 Tax=Lolliginicoccus lacisalsi TaxID=2742202 RepID=A0A927JBK6_9ACTN|nr:M17 family metallopeptidase [Lolliginicoccus lacisalsi]MBD8506288.1 peptidase M17 [Lolliginicoccus lacisalsi]